MLGRLLPRDEKFFELFDQLAGHLATTAQMLDDLFGDPQNVSQHVKLIKDVEHKADLLTTTVNQRIDKSFITPIDREDIHDLASALDDILDVAEAIADRFVLYKVTTPTERAVKLADVLYQASVAVGAGVDRLGLAHPDIKECSVQVNSLENEADRISRDAISALFEKETDPMAVIKWKEIYEGFEAGTDRCEDVANILERIALKHH